jgi:pyruvate,water dikinase
VAFASLEDLQVRAPIFAERFRWVQALPMQWARDLDRYLLALGRMNAIDFETLDRQELWEHILELDQIGRSYFLPNIALSIAQGLMHRMLFRLTAMVVGPEAAPACYDGLTCACDTKTMLVNQDLYALYRIADQNPRLAERLRDQDRRQLYTSGDLEAFSTFHAAFKRFIEDHGHREVDFDAYQPTWSGQPWVVLENLRLMLLRGEVPDPGAQDRAARARQHANEREFLARLPESLRTFAGELTRLCRTYTALDDLEHYQTTRLSVPFRAALVALGGHLVRDGVMQEPSDIFFLSRATLAGYLAGDIPLAVAAAELQTGRTDHLRQCASDPPFQFGAEPEAPPSGDALRGLPGAPGVADGLVRIVRSSEDFASFPPGSILVARTTNPAWTPLFYAAAAVITESGGPLSHGAVTARELGIPAVVALRGAMRIFADGERVRVYGTEGVVSRLAEAED